MPGPTPHYPPEFKQEAVRLYRSSNRSPAAPTRPASPATCPGWSPPPPQTAAALFDPGLRDAVNVAAERWVGCVRELILTGQDEGSIPRSVDPQAAAERLTGVTDSLGTKWLTGGLSSERTRELVRGAIELELGVVLKGSKRTGTPR